MNYKQYSAARKHGYRSGLELKVAQYLDTKKVIFKYEAIKIEWEDLAYRTYTPDFILPNNIIIEAKGRYDRIIPESWLKEKSLTKLKKFIACKERRAE